MLLIKSVEILLRIKPRKENGIWPDDPPTTCLE